MYLTGSFSFVRRYSRISATVAASLSRMGLPGADPVEVVTRRIPHLYPILHRGYGADLAAVERWLEHAPRVATLGRAGLFTGDNTHHALAMGAEAAAAVRPDGSFDRNRWTASLDRFGDHVVED